jgi:hypothetical protein
MTTEHTSIPPNATILATKSWTAYCSVFAVASVMLLVFVLLFSIGNIVLGLGVMLLAAGFLIYRIADILSYKLYYDQNGVWIYSGVLPWSRGVNGVKWRDLDEAAFFQSALGWMANSYTIRISHRYTKSEEIRMTHTANGLRVAGQVNLLHQERLKNGDIT